MNVSTKAIEERIQQSFEDRMQALQLWLFGEQGEKVCPCCFATWISVCYTNGWESLECRECGAKGPLPKRELESTSEKMPVLHARRRVIAKKVRSFVPQKQHKIHHFSVAW